MKKLTFILLLLFSLNYFAQVNRNDTIRVENYPKDSVSVDKPRAELEVLTDIQEANAPVKALKFNPCLLYTSRCV